MSCSIECIPSRQGRTKESGGCIDPFNQKKIILMKRLLHPVFGGRQDAAVIAFLMMTLQFQLIQDIDERNGR